MEDFSLFSYPGILFIILFVLLAAVLVILILNMLKINSLKNKYDVFMKGRSAKSLEEDIFEMFDQNNKMRADINDNSRDIRSIYKQLSTATQKVALQKYDAYDQMGGKLSYCLAMLDEYDNGFIINNVHSTGNTYSYIKKIVDGQCDLDLSEEEADTLNRAMFGEKNEADQN
ncbi:MAG: DUF4446 family protein [Lachnospiraceae bacterium]|nr:DUF4446 family protein [Lachnospiraceae bacterium]